MHLKRRDPLRYLLVLPAVATICFMILFPSALSFWLSLHDITRSTFFGSPSFVGIKNYIIVLSDPFFLDALRVSLGWILLTTSVELLLGLGLSLLLNQDVPYKGAFTVLLLTPMVISPVTAAYMFSLLLNNLFGPVSILLERVGLRASLLGDPSLAFFTVAAIDVWQWTPFMFLLIYTGVRAIPAEPIEAAIVDGASPWQLFARVTLPLLKPIIAVALIFRMMDSFKTFDMIYVLTGGGPGRTTETLNIYIYRMFSRGDIGLMLALCTMLLAIIPMISRLYMRLLYGAPR